MTLKFFLDIDGDGTILTAMAPASAVKDIQRAGLRPEDELDEPPLDFPLEWVEAYRVGAVVFYKRRDA